MLIAAIVAWAAVLGLSPGLALVAIALALLVADRSGFAAALDHIVGETR